MYIQLVPIEKKIVQILILSHALPPLPETSLCGAFHLISLTEMKRLQQCSRNVVATKSQLNLVTATISQRVAN